MTDSIIASGLKGIQSGLRQVAENAEKFVRSFDAGSEIEPVEPLIAVKTGELQVKASAKVIGVGDDLNETILDILA